MANAHIQERLPGPLCGEKGEYDQNREGHPHKPEPEYRIRCSSGYCVCETPFDYEFKTLNEAIKAWNTRTKPSPCPDIVEALGEVKAHMAGEANAIQEQKDLDDWNCNDFKGLPNGRVQSLMADTAYPESRSVKHAIEQACNELYFLNKHLRNPQAQLATSETQNTVQPTEALMPNELDSAHKIVRGLIDFVYRGDY